MRVLATADIQSASLEAFALELSGDIPIEISSGRVVLLSLDPPSWVNLIGKLEWWQVPLVGVAALFVAELTKEAAKSTWKVSAKAASDALGSATRLAKLAVAIMNLNRQIGQRSEIIISLPEPSEYFGARLNLMVDDPDVLQAQIALFVVHLPALAALVETHKRLETPPATGYFLSVDGEMGMRVLWFDGKTLQKCETCLPLQY